MAIKFNQKVSSVLSISSNSATGKKVSSAKDFEGPTRVDKDVKIPSPLLYFLWALCQAITPSLSLILTD